MKQSQCLICKEMVYGYSAKDLKYKKLMHSIKHRTEEPEHFQDTKEEPEETK